MPAGRPRTVSLPPDEMIKLGKEMIEWVKNNNPLHLSQWYCIEKGYTDSEWDTMHVAPEFFPYYEKALKMVGIQYLAKDSNVDSNIKQRWQRVYFKDLKKSEDEKTRHDLEAKAKVGKETEDVATKLANALNKFIEQKEAKDE
jgi:hypothetical protein